MRDDPNANGRLESPDPTESQSEFELDADSAYPAAVPPDLSQERQESGQLSVTNAPPSFASSEAALPTISRSAPIAPSQPSSTASLTSASPSAVATSDSQSQTRRVSWPIHLMLTEEELTLILLGLQAEYLPGFQPVWAPDSLRSRFPSHGVERLEVAGRSLVARGLLIPPGQPGGSPHAWTLPAAIYGLVGACAFADVTLHLQVQTPGESQETYLHGLGDLAVARTVPMDQMEEITYLGRKSRLPKAVGSFFYFDGQQAIPSFPLFRISAEDFQLLRLFLGRKQRKDAELFLHRLKCEKEAAIQLCDALAETRVTGTITIGRYEQTPAGGSLRRSDYREPNQTLSWAIMVAPNTIFTLHDAPAPPQRSAPQPQPQLLLQSIGAEDMLRELEAFL